MMVIDFATGQRLNDDDVQLLKGSDFEKFTRSLSNLLSRGYVITILNITIKMVPRIGKVVTYFAELKVTQD
jgi:hypothetical protein